MAKNPGAKGSVFERDICRILTQWVIGQPKPEIFWRSATSGAKATVEHKAGRTSHMGGDIVSVHPDGNWLMERFSIECKNRKSMGTLPHFLLGTANMLDWWNQCVEDANIHGKIPWLIFKQKGSKVYTCIPTKQTPFHGIGFETEIDIYGNEPLRIMLLDTLLRRNPYERFKLPRPHRI